MAESEVIQRLRARGGVRVTVEGTLYEMRVLLHGYDAPAAEEPMLTLDNVDLLLAAEREDERARIVWWLRAAAAGVGVVHADPCELATIQNVADAIEEHPERFADAPTGKEQAHG
jgi:hypothetical protein